MKVLKNIGVINQYVYDKVSNETAIKKIFTGKYRYSTKNKFRSILKRGNIILTQIIEPQKLNVSINPEKVWIHNVNTDMKQSLWQKFIAWIKKIFNWIPVSTGIAGVQKEC